MRYFSALSIVAALAPLATPLPGWAAPIKTTTISLSKIDVKASGGGWNLTVNGSVTLSPDAGKITGYTMCFQDPDGKTVVSATRPFESPPPGKAVDFTYYAFPQPVTMKGTWYAIVEITDDSDTTVRVKKKFSIK